jgi:hypothetical protein
MTAKSNTIKAEKNLSKKIRKSICHTTAKAREKKERKKETRHTKKTIKHGNSHI